ncbi:MAG: tyrosine--tRNA ligase [Pirellulaceae bacterium]|nr:MAG: tyrosine--tRNA ligase [Pirellulaceae bacterium]
MATDHILEELQWRGLIHQSTDPQALRQLLSKPTVVYAGFDPTAPSLHCGSLLPLMMLRRFQQFGHRPIALVGGATGMIGDPSGRSEERVLLSEETLQENVAGLQRTIERFLDFEHGGLLVNNFDWMKEWSYISFLRDVGKNFPINVMLAKDSVKSRLERDDVGMSYTEFSYMLLQAYDFVHLHRQFDCTLQIGGSDQWGNITAGIDLGRRMLGVQLHGLTCPLLLTKDGRKMGKTAQGAVWLDAQRTSPYAFYQYWVRVHDDDVLMCLRYLTEIEQDEYRELERAVKEEPHRRAAQTRLASWLTEFVHGPDGLQAAERAREVLFGAEIADLQDEQLVEIFADVPGAEIPTAQLQEGIALADAFVRVGLCKSKSEARRIAQQGGAYVNNRPVPEDYVITRNDLASPSIIVLRSGKKKFGLLKLADTPLQV